MQVNNAPDIYIIWSFFSWLFVGFEELQWSAKVGSLGLTNEQLDHI